MRNDPSMWKTELMRIRKHPNGNEYIHAGEVWVRNYTNTRVAARHIDSLIPKSDYSVMVANEQLNSKRPRISDEKIHFENVVIVSDGYDFDQRHLFIGKLPKNTCVLAINNALKMWQLLNTSTPPDERKTINAYVVNNPYAEALSFLPPKNAKYFPTCIASIRTNDEFVKKYRGDVYVYRPTFENEFGLSSTETYYVDDYRNPICACIDLAFHFGAKKIMLVCCDNSFSEQRDYAVKLQNDLWTYPQHVYFHRIIDAKLYWLKNYKEREIKVSDYSSGPEYVNAQYIHDESEALSFFTDEDGATI